MSLKHAILALLARESRTGYELAKGAEGSTSFFWTATHQQIYRDLADLERMGWVKHKDVEQTEKPDKKIYSTTKDGLSELKRWMGEETEPGPSKDALLIKLFAGYLVDPNVLLTDLQKQKEAHQARKDEYREIEKEYFQHPERLPIEGQFQYLTLRRGITYETSWLSWCKEVEDFLRLKIREQEKSALITIQAAFGDNANGRKIAGLDSANMQSLGDVATQSGAKVTKIVDWDYHVLCYVSSFTQAGNGGSAISQQCFPLNEDNKAIKTAK